jgi:hypothetical protein
MPPNHPIPAFISIPIDNLPLHFHENLADQFVVERFRGYVIEPETILYLSTAITTFISLVFHLYFLSGRSAESSIKKFIDRNKAVAITWNVIYIGLWAASLVLMFELSNRWRDIVAEFVETRDANLLQALGNSTVRFDYYAENSRLAGSTSLGAGIVGILFLISLVVGLWDAVSKDVNEAILSFKMERNSETRVNFTFNLVKSY